MKKLVGYQTNRHWVFVTEHTLRQETGDVCPMSGEWLIPEGFILIKPPEHDHKSQAAVWTGEHGGWVICEKKDPWEVEKFDSEQPPHTS